MKITKNEYFLFIYKQRYTNMNKLKCDQVIIIRLPNEIKTEYENLLDNNGMNLSKRLKVLINDDIKKLKMK